MSIEGSIEQLADAGLLTDRQAEAFILREIEACPRQAAAEHMGISVNTLDNTLGRARKLVGQAQATAEAVEDIRHEDLPSECDGCGSTLGGSWSTDNDGNAICFSCAGINLPLDP